MTARVDILTRPRKLGIMGLLLAGTALSAAGCAQQRSEGYYDPSAESTITDAQAQGAGAGYRAVLRAPSQVQIALEPEQKKASDPAARHATAKDDQPVPESADNDTRAVSAPTQSAAAHSLVPQPQTYMGTLPCFSPLMQCTVQRVTLTLAPNNRWRGRTAYLENDSRKAAPVAEQGCWAVTGERPPRIILLDSQGNARVEFVATANNVLRVRAIGGQTPNLNYNLTRQPDLDPIDELAKAKAPQCP